MDERKIILTEEELRELISDAHGLGMATCNAMDWGSSNWREEEEFDDTVKEFIESHLVSN